MNQKPLFHRYRTFVYIGSLCFTAFIFTYLFYLHPQPPEPFLMSYTPQGELGYILALTFGDQGTSAFINLLSFVCLASKMGSVIVEPFMVGSDLGQNVGVNWTEETKFSNVFDLKSFNHFAMSRNYSPLVPYDVFLKDAPRNLLIAQYKCAGITSCRSCGHRDVIERGRIFSEMNGFEFVGHVCLDYGDKGHMSIAQLENQLYAKYRKSEVVIMFIRFGGVYKGKFYQKKGYRLFLNPPVCYRNDFPKSMIRPSQLVSASANAFIRKYLDGKSYISVMIRIQMILRSHVQDRQAPQLTEECLKCLYKKLKKLQVKVGIKNMFLALDVGKYGSNIFREKHIMTPILPYFDVFVSQTIKKGMTLSDWDERFTNITENQNPGYIAVIQKYIAARGDVLVLLGAESVFQASTHELYDFLHKNKKVFKLETCCG